MGREGGAPRWAVEEENEREREASRGGREMVSVIGLEK
jgi:hypothetical protein